MEPRSGRLSVDRTLGDPNRRSVGSSVGVGVMKDKGLKLEEIVGT